MNPKQEGREYSFTRYSVGGGMGYYFFSPDDRNKDRNSQGGKTHGDMTFVADCTSHMTATSTAPGLVHLC